MNRLFLIFGICLSHSVMGQVEVCPSCEVNSIGQAITVAKDYDEIIISAGVYYESGLKIEKPISLIGNGEVIIDGKKQGYIIEILSDSVTISGLTLRNVGMSHTKDYAGIHAYNSDYLTIQNNRLENVFFGILVEKSSYGVIKDNVVRGEYQKEFYSGNGIHLWHCKNMLVRNNDLAGLRDGIYFEFVDDSKVEDNDSHNNIRYGLHFMFSNRDDYEGNKFHNNGAGVAVMFSKFINMKRNSFYDNWGTTSYGLLLKEIYDGVIENNQFRENTVGINVDGSTRILYFENQFERNGWAVKVTGGCYSNVFERNNFISNSFDVSYNSKVNDNEFSGNFWSSYSGYDLDKDGIGDVPYRPVKLFSYVVNRTPETIILLRSLFIDLINFSERVTPVFTPDNLQDFTPLMKKTSW